MKVQPNELPEQIKGFKGETVEGYRRTVTMKIAGRAFEAPVFWAHSDEVSTVLGREVVFDLFDMGMLGPCGCSVMMTFTFFLGASLGLRSARKRVETARVVVAEEGLTVVDEEGIELRFAWPDLLQVEEVDHSVDIFNPSLSARAVLAPKAIQVRTPWGIFEIDCDLEEYKKLLELLQRIVEERDQPPAYPAEVQMVSEASLSRARPSATPTPTQTSLSRAEETEEEQTRLTEEVTDDRPRIFVAD